jgi:MAPEG family
MTGAALAIILAAVVLLNAPNWFSDFAPSNYDVAARLAFAVTWLVVPGLTLFAGVFGASRRGFYADAIEGTRSPASHSLEINLRYNQNTIEQVILASVGWLALSQILPRDELVLIPAMAVLFTVGRLTFWVGYALHPMARTFGMTLTVVPTIVAYALLILAVGA